MEEDGNGSMVTTVCPKCDRALEVEAGDSVQCIHCGHLFRFSMQFGNFLLERLLASGGMGSVYLGRDVILNRYVAVKVLQPEFARDEKFLQTFLQEAEITASLNHPNIVHVYTFGEQGGYHYLVMEYIEGGTLDDKIDKFGTITELEAIEIGIAVARGLEFAAKRGLIHRDIKPGNIVFGQNNTPKVVDFGLSRPISSTENLSGEIWGTPFYVTPEKLEGRAEDFRGDLYSLAATLFHAIAGRPPYEGKDAMEVATKHLNGNVVSLRAFIPTITDSLANAIKKAMSRRPEDRHKSYEEFIIELEDAKRRVVEKLRTNSGRKPIPRDEDSVVIKPVLQGQYLGWVISLAILFGLLVLLAAIWATSTGTKNTAAGMDDYQLNASPIPSPDTSSSQWYVFSPDPLGLSVKNPLAGWRGSRQPGEVGSHTVDANFETLKRWAIGWNEIESQKSDGPEKIQSFMAASWKDLPALNEKVIPRIVIIDGKGSYAPTDLPAFTLRKENWEDSPWYVEPSVQTRIQRLISRLGELWDNDPRVAWVEVGIEGKAGENGGLTRMPSFALWLTEQFSHAFHNKKFMFASKDLGVLKRDTDQYDFGYYQDTVGFQAYREEFLSIAKLDYGIRWKHAVMGGEVHLDKNPIMSWQMDHNLSGVALQTLLDWTRFGHYSYLGWERSLAIPPNLPGATDMRSALGYHFLIKKFSQLQRVEAGKNLNIRFEVLNTGSSPFYYKWPVQVALVDEQSRKVVYSKILDQVDIRSWLPGSDWNFSTHAYDTLPSLITVNASLPIPKNLPVGTYVTTLAILDPEGGNLPSIRFEIKNYWKGGLHPMGRVGVGVDIKDPQIDPSSFFTDPLDPTLHYTVPKSQ